LLEKQLAEAERALAELEREKIELGMVDPSKMDGSRLKRIECQLRITDLTEILERTRALVPTKTAAFVVACLEVDRAEIRQERVKLDELKRKVSVHLKALKELEGVEYEPKDIERMTRLMAPADRGYTEHIPLTRRTETALENAEKQNARELSDPLDYGSRFEGLIGA
jgi:DNA-binding transcriptional ArsR family regulator